MEKKTPLSTKVRNGRDTSRRKKFSLIQRGDRNILRRIIVLLVKH